MVGFLSARQAHCPPLDGGTIRLGIDTSYRLSNSPVERESRKDLRRRAHDPA